MLTQILIVAIFVIMFVVITTGKVHRFIPALIGAGVTLLVLVTLYGSGEAALGVLNFAEIGLAKFWYPGHEGLESHGVNWQTVVFIGGMMAMVEGMAAAGFFRWLCLLVAKLVHYRIVPVFIAFMLLSGFLSMFIDSITVLLFMATVTVELAKLLKTNPVPIIIAEIFAANTGGAATMAGDPPNIIIGTAFGFTFTDFLLNTGTIAWVAMIAALIFFFLVFRRSLSAAQAKEPVKPGQYPEPRSAIANMRQFQIGTGIFLLVVVLLVTHAQTGISVATIGVIAFLLTIAAAGQKGAGHIVKRIDWRTLLFFVGLFVVVGGLEVTGALKLFAQFIQNSAGTSFFLLVTIILWASAIISALVDNIPLAATMVPVVASLAGTDLATLKTLSWTLALGTDIGGNATPIGASANVVGTAIAEREGYPIGWGRFCKVAIPATILVLAVCWGLIRLWHL